MSETFGIATARRMTSEELQIAANQYPGRTTGDKPPIDADAPPEEDR